MIRKAHLIFILIPLWVFVACTKNKVTNTEPAGTDSATTAYDSLLADSLGADDWGMRSYVMAFLKDGPQRSQDSAEAARLMRAHLDNINRLAAEGKLVLAGPFMGNSGKLRGLYLFATSDTAEARLWTNSDPSVQAGRLVMELIPWYGSAALPALNALHDKISREKI